MVATTAEYPIDPPARRAARRSSSILPCDQPASADTAHLRGADLICQACGEVR